MLLAGNGGQKKVNYFVAAVVFWFADHQNTVFVIIIMLV